MPPFAPIPEAFAELRRGRMVVVCEGEGGERGGDLLVAAQFASAAAVNFMAGEARGLICLALEPERIERLQLDLLPARNGPAPGAAFTVSIEAAAGVSTGISAADRSRTIAVAIDPASSAADLHQPGHVFPLRALPGGVLERPSRTEAAVDLPRLAGLNPAGVICEILAEDGTVARLPELLAYCRRHRLKMVTTADLAGFRRRTEKLVERTATTSLPSQLGEFEAVGYRSLLDRREHLALVKGEVEGASEVLVGIHSECRVGDVFHSRGCQCRERLEAALAQIEGAGRGVLVYLGRDGLGPAPAATEAGDHGVEAQILADLGPASIRLLGAEPGRLAGLAAHGLTVRGESAPAPPAPAAVTSYAS